MSFDADRARQVAESFDLKALSPDFYADPFPYYHALREHAPVKRLPDGGYLLTRYAEVELVYKNPEELAAYIGSETAKWAKVVKEANIKVE